MGCNIARYLAILQYKGLNLAANSYRRSLSSKLCSAESLFIGNLRSVLWTPSSEKKKKTEQMQKLLSY
jgi:hypothetical protein